MEAFPDTLVDYIYVKNIESFVNIMGIMNAKYFSQVVSRVDGPNWEVVVPGNSIADESTLEKFGHKVRYS